MVTGRCEPLRGFQRRTPPREQRLRPLTRPQIPDGVYKLRAA